MQYSAAMILLHRPLAQFGKDGAMQSSASEISRQVCIDNACSIAKYLQEYHEAHGSVLTMSWIALHIIATASTTLIASVAERKAGPDAERQLDCLRRCLDALSELEKSHVVTRRVRKVIQHAIRLLNLDATVNPVAASVVGRFGSFHTPLPMPFAAAAASVTTPGVDLQSLPFLDLLPAVLPAVPQFDGLNSFESYFS